MVAIHITKNEGAPLGMLLKTTTVGVGELRRNVIAVKSLSETGLAIAAGVQVGDVVSHAVANFGVLSHSSCV
eukprot:m.188218 g.188218  ORF g.188218 m.188218 type:complete len:72 (-) comp14787_c0_seq11:1927-2142(-)